MESFVKAATCVVLLLGVATACLGAPSKLIRLATMADLASVWVTPSPQTVEFLRLQLAETGLGVLTIQYLPDTPAQAYEVRGTRLTKRRVTFDLYPLEATAEPIVLHGDALPTHLTLELAGKSGTWKRQIELVPLPQFLNRLEVVTNRAAEVGGVNK
jgi:hypothetical protein